MIDGVPDLIGEFLKLDRLRQVVADGKTPENTTLGIPIALRITVFSRKTDAKSHPQGVLGVRLNRRTMLIVC